jgi:hypothetical protein
MKRRGFFKLITFALALFSPGKKSVGASPETSTPQDAVERLQEALWISRRRLKPEETPARTPWTDPPFDEGVSSVMRKIDVSDPEIQAMYSDIPRIKLPAYLFKK